MLDLDGTLVHSEHVHRQVWERFFATWRLDVDDERYTRVVMGRPARDVLPELAGPWRPEDVPAIVAGLHADDAAGARDVVPVDGASELVRELRRRGHRLAVVTSAVRTWADQVLGDVLGVADVIEVLVTVEDVAAGKPSPEGYLLACRRLGVEPARCAAIEDSPSGIQALAAAGVRTVVGVTTTFPADVLRVAGATATVPDLHPAVALVALSGSS